MEILVSNDDGVDAPGLLALAEGLRELGNVTVVAPDRERSAVAHALTLTSPLRLTEVRPGWYSTDGTPTDCVHLGVHAVCGRAPDLVVAGINRGPNMGDDLTYSGTVGVALEGALLGIPSIAVSLAARENENYGPAAVIARAIAAAVAREGLPDRTFLNVNVPNAPSGKMPGPVKITTQGRRVFGSGIVKKKDPRGRDYYWIGGSELGYVDGDETSDVQAVAAGMISVTPLSTDLTARTLYEKLKSWRFTV